MMVTPIRTKASKEAVNSVGERKWWPAMGQRWLEGGKSPHLVLSSRTAGHDESVMWGVTQAPRWTISVSGIVVCRAGKCWKASQLVVSGERSR